MAVLAVGPVVVVAESGTADGISHGGWGGAACLRCGPIVCGCYL